MAERISEIAGLRYLTALLNIKNYDDIFKIGLSFWRSDDELDNGAITILRNYSKLFCSLSDEDKKKITSDASDKFDYKYVLGVTFVDNHGNIEIAYHRIIQGLSGFFLAEIQLDFDYAFSETLREKGFGDGKNWDIQQVKLFTEQFHNPLKFKEYDTNSWNEALANNNVEYYNSTVRKNSYLGTMLNSNQIEDAFTYIKRFGYEVNLCQLYDSNSLYEFISGSETENIFDYEARYFSALIKNELMFCFENEPYYSSFVSRVWIQDAIEVD